MTTTLAVAAAPTTVPTSAVTPTQRPSPPSGESSTHNVPHTSPPLSSSSSDRTGRKSRKSDDLDTNSRKKNSLSVLAETFVAQFAPVQPTATGVEMVVDTLARELQVERRRVYDVINILEALQLVVKRGKNTYHWMGKEHLDQQFALLQDQAIARWPKAAIKHGLLLGTDVPKVNRSAASERTSSLESSKSLTRLSQLFVQVFLVGHDQVSLPLASDIIQGYESTTEKLAQLGCCGGALPTDPIQFHAAAARGLKTKIRRLYDIANVFLAVGLLVRCDHAAAGGKGGGRRPHYQWNYTRTPQEIREQVWKQLSDRQKREKTPFESEQTAAMEGMGLNPKQYNNNKNNSQSSSSCYLATTKSLLGKRARHDAMGDKSAPVGVKPASPGKLSARRVSLPAAEQQPRIPQV